MAKKAEAILERTLRLTVRGPDCGEIAVTRTDGGGASFMQGSDAIVATPDVVPLLIQALQEIAGGVPTAAPPPPKKERRKKGELETAILHELKKRTPANPYMTAEEIATGIGGTLDDVRTPLRRMTGTTLEKSTDGKYYSIRQPGA